jgi:hypothetical protein
MAGCTRALHHTLTVIERAPRTIDNHIKSAPLELIESLIITTVSINCFNPVRNRLTAAGEQGEAVTLLKQTADQRLANKAGSTHQQDLHEHPGRPAVIEAR